MALLANGQAGPLVFSKDRVHCKTNHVVADLLPALIAAQIETGLMLGPYGIGLFGADFIPLRPRLSVVLSGTCSLHGFSKTSQFAQRCSLVMPVFNTVPNEA